MKWMKLDLFKNIATFQCKCWGNRLLRILLFFSSFDFFLPFSPTRFFLWFYWLVFFLFLILLLLLPPSFWLLSFLLAGKIAARNTEVICPKSLSSQIAEMAQYRANININSWFFSATNSIIQLRLIVHDPIPSCNNPITEHKSSFDKTGLIFCDVMSHITIRLINGCSIDISK